MFFLYLYEGGGGGGGLNFVHRNFRFIEFDFAARILIQLIIPKLFQFKHKISTLVVA